MKYLLVALLATAAFAAPDVEDEIISSEVVSDVESAQFMSPMGMGMGQPFMVSMANKRRSYSSGCMRSCPCVQRCVVVWWVPCPCWCPPPCDDGDQVDPPTEPPTQPPTEPPTQPPTSPPNDCNTCSCVWVPCTIWWMCRPRCPSTCCAPRPPPCCSPCQPCTSWPCNPCNPCNNPCQEENRKEPEIEKLPEPRFPNMPDLDEWRDRLREGLNVILAPSQPEPEWNWWEQEQQQPQRPAPRPPVRQAPQPPVRRP